MMRFSSYSRFCFIRAPISAQNFALRLVFGIFAFLILRFLATALYSYKGNFFTRMFSQPTAPPPPPIGLSSRLGTFLATLLLLDEQAGCGIVDNTNQAVSDESRRNVFVPNARMKERQ
jgi:hypothetical protein